MVRTLSEEAVVKVPASKAWGLYGTLELAKLSVGKMLKAFDVEEGDGGTGTILNLTFLPGLGFEYAKEKFTKVDNDNMVKEAETVEGGFHDFGFTYSMIRFEVKENPNDVSGSSCVVKLTIEYEVAEEAAANASLVTNATFLAILSMTTEHLEKSD